MTDEPSNPYREPRPMPHRRDVDGEYAEIVDYVAQTLQILVSEMEEFAVREWAVEIMGDAIGWATWIHVREALDQLYRAGVTETPVGVTAPPTHELVVRRRRHALPTLGGR